MALSTLALVTLTLSGVSASKHLPPPKAEVAPNQLETARLTQAAQRAEFGVEGDASAFKFAFADLVCSPTPMHLPLQLLACPCWCRSVNVATFLVCQAVPS